MKHTVPTLVTAIMPCTLAQGKNRTVTENDSLKNPKRVIELRDTMINGKSATDMFGITTYKNSAHRHTGSDSDYKSHNNAYDFDWNIGHNTREAIIAIITIVSVLGLSLAVVFTVFFFRYKNRKAKYCLVEQALASRRSLPEHLLKDTESTDTRSKGIKNALTGIELFIFLWVTTGEFGLGCIGLFIMFTGFGQAVIYYTQQHKALQSSGQLDNTETGFPEKNEEK